MKKFQKIFGVFEKRRIAPRKGGKHHQLSNEKGGENVEPNSREFYKQCAFQKFCNTVLHNEAWYGFRDMITHIIVWIVIEHKTCRVKLLQLILPYIITNDIEN